MTTTVRLDPFVGADDLWARVASDTCDWAAEHGLALVDVVVLVPYAHHIACARRAYAARGVDLPQIDTLRTLAAAVAPPAASRPGALSLDAATDRLVALRHLPRRFAADRAAAAQAASSIVATAQALAAAAAAVSPDERPSRFGRWRQRLSVGTGVHGEHELALARFALDWAAEAPAPSTDALFRLRPAGWVLVQADIAPAQGTPAPETPATALLAAAEVPTLRFDASLDADARAALTRRDGWTLAVCRDFEDEAQRSAATVIAHLNAGRAPVALVSQDRLVVRRVHALLARQRIPIKDETGWTMSTTRAAAALRSVLRCARHGSTSDDWLDWLKSCPGVSGTDVDGIERGLRRQHARLPAKLDLADSPASMQRTWLQARQVIEALASPSRRSFERWHQSFAEAVGAFGLGRALAADAAGEQLLATLRLDPPRAPPTIDAASQIDLPTYADWVETAMEQSTFLPPVADDAASHPVVITPLGRAAWRPFGAIVVPGADGASFGTASVASTLFGQSDAAQLGLPDRDGAQARQQDALGQLLRQPRVDFLRRAVHDGEAWPQSPSLQWLEFMRGSAAPRADDPRDERRWPFAPVARPLPRAGPLLPDTLSASACSALRACPYRFHALHLLKLREADELDVEGSKRDYGNWLHEVLHRFHGLRGATADPAADEALLLDCGRRTAADVEPEDFVPYTATFERFVPRYLDWWHAREATGARWLAGEVSLVAMPAEWDGCAMVGKLDRIDAPVAGSEARDVIDYKTGSKDRLKLGIHTDEDVQLPFYAALMAAQPDTTGDIRASYLLLDDAQGIVGLACPEADVRGAALVEGIGHDLRRLRGGAPMPALGEGDACGHCAARGLCRRDHWAPPETAPDASAPPP